MKKPTIGLFGTCGRSTWRDSFIKEYERLGIQYFNPQKDDWKPEDAQIEAKHLANDEILLFPVTNETFAFGSLAETGFSILQAIKFNKRRELIVMIVPNVIASDTEVDQVQRKESCRARALVMAHLKKLNYPNVWIVTSLNDMLALSISLHSMYIAKSHLKDKYAPK